MNAINNKKGTRMKKVVNWFTNRLDKWFKFKTVKLFNFEAEDMKVVGYGLITLAFAIVINAGVNAYAIHEGKTIHQTFEVNIIKKEEAK
ncbi:hypothetical protein PA10_00189 [Pseudomonas phage pPa_SNUABM_DT01]|nr:hypothetical protein PA10_00189 [Pseudomonas phage pPa_SNUABM_DT01]